MIIVLVLNYQPNGSVQIILAEMYRSFYENWVKFKRDFKCQKLSHIQYIAIIYIIICILQVGTLLLDLFYRKWMKREFLVDSSFLLRISSDISLQATIFMQQINQANQIVDIFYIFFLLLHDYQFAALYISLRPTQKSNIEYHLVVIFVVLKKQQKCVLIVLQYICFCIIYNSQIVHIIRIIWVAIVILIIAVLTYGFVIPLVRT
eukprot:TRINITY_DN12166_c1_g1_i11.p2 TRINITY_DN12166_c1_g1~~TRINITY_DN12166_c1_g1_i11.p2  ORF type:complete len:205 (+),score=-9.45 TRINITY_DN12166_c1_g1_i11:615-1229(+)